jgi:hypothetical protein
MMRRDTVLEIGGYREAFQNAEDYDLWLRLAREHDLGNVPEPLLRYRFSVGGMTLGRKWQQLYYVHLAQAANRDPSLSMRDVEEVARASLADVDRRSFMRHVAAATVDELIGLRLWPDAMHLSSRFAGEVGRKATFALVAKVGIARARAVTVRGSDREPATPNRYRPDKARSRQFEIADTTCSGTRSSRSSRYPNSVRDSTGTNFNRRADHCSRGWSLLLPEAGWGSAAEES